MTSARRPAGRTPATYDPVMGDRKTSLTVTVDPRLVAYAEQLVEAGKAPDVSAVVNDALSEKAGRDALDRLRETAARADPAKVDRMLAHIDAQAAALPER
jgi:Arc/MetJ-type ribon-helix-helix transcriptional regulator